jgi:prepilin-type N-terminal cleavage/methylation domain-containing protein
MGTTRRSFTLIELLIVIGIISILIGVLVPSISRSLSSNRLASDVEVLRAKIEEARLLAGSTQTADEQLGVPIPGADRVGYYGLFFPSADILRDQLFPSKPDFYAIIRLSRPLGQSGEGYCDPNKVIHQLMSSSGNGDCVIERINLTSGVVYDRSTLEGQRTIAYKVPSQQVVELCQPPNIDYPAYWTCRDSSKWNENPGGPLFNLTNGDGAPYIRLKYNNKNKAEIRVEKYTGKLVVQYGTI